MKKTDLYLDALLEKFCMEVSPESLLDVGCGSNSPIQRFSSKIPKTVGMDGFLPSIEKSRAKNIHRQYIEGDLLQSLASTKSKSFDIVIAMDVIEHFEKDQGWKFLGELERIASKRVIVFTPNGFLPQGEYDDNPNQLHCSGWEIKEFIDRGYAVFGVNGLKWLKGEYGAPRFKPRWLANRISDYTQFITYSRPSLAFQLLAVK